MKPITFKNEEPLLTSALKGKQTKENQRTDGRVFVDVIFPPAEGRQNEGSRQHPDVGPIGLVQFWNDPEKRPAELGHDGQDVDHRFCEAFRFFGIARQEAKESRNKADAIGEHSSLDDLHVRQDGVDEHGDTDDVQRLKDDDHHKIEEAGPFPLPKETNTGRTEPHEEFRNDETEEQRPHP